MTVAGPDASQRIGHQWFYREALLALMLQEGWSLPEIARRLGVSPRLLRKYVNLEPVELSRATPLQYPQQYLIELMLDTATKQRLMRTHPWHRKGASNGTRS